MEQILEKLFESTPKVRILRLFMQNPEDAFEFSEIAKRVRIKPQAVRSELRKLMKIGLFKEKNAIIRREIVKKSSSRKKPPKILVKTKKAKVFCLNQDFIFWRELRDLIVKASVASRKKMLRQIQNLGRVKLAVLAGIFVENNSNYRTDLLLVGDGIKKGKLDNFLEEIQSELGRSLNYTIMETDEFRYRLDMYDRFIRDILEYPHEKLINKLRI